MTRITHINRPWFSSFSFPNAVFSDTKLEQVNKLARNFVCSLDLGAPHVKHVQKVGLPNPYSLPNNQDVHDISGLDEHQRYLLWVDQWKQIYRQISSIIRELKTWRRTVRFPKLTEEQTKYLTQFFNSQYNSKEGPSSIESWCNTLAYDHLPRLQETAMVMLNARYNAKLASHALRERRRQESFADKAMAATCRMEKLDYALNSLAATPNELLKDLTFVPGGDPVPGGEAIHVDFHADPYKYDTNDRQPK